MILHKGPKTDHIFIGHWFCIAVMMREETGWTLDIHEILIGIFLALAPKWTQPLRITVRPSSLVLTLVNAAL